MTQDDEARQVAAQLTEGAAGRRVLITGGGSGLGRAMVDRFVRAGWRVLATDIDDAALAAVEAAHSRSGLVTVRRLDVRDDGAWVRARQWCEDTWGGLDVLVNNAGIEIGKPLTEMTEQEFERIFRVNVHGVFHGIKHGVPALAPTRGAIINMSSVAGLGGVPLLGAYAASKAAVLRLTQTAATELREAGIRVNAICPSFIDTEMVGRLVDPFEAATGADFGDLTAQAQGRLGTPEEVAQTAVFLASDDARWVTGSYYILDNALTASVL